jgi:hypothetical protein
MQVKSASKYDLRDLHQEIDFYDRKIAHCQNFEKFDSEADRAAALRKLGTQRGIRVKKALEIAGRGIECDPKYLPRSFSKDAAEVAKLAS